MEELLKSIDTKMNAIISLLLNQSILKQEDMSEGEKIKLLNNAGLSNKELAKLFDKTPKNISDQIYLAKRKKK